MSGPLFCTHAGAAAAGAAATGAATDRLVAARASLAGRQPAASLPEAVRRQINAGNPNPHGASEDEQYRED